MYLSSRQDHIRRYRCLRLSSAFVPCCNDRNHDPEPADNIGGTFDETVAVDALTFRHLPTRKPNEICGHLHPMARVSHRGCAVSRRCFAADHTRMVMPAFGVYTGGLNVRAAVFADLFGTLAFTAHMLGENRLYAIAAQRCLPN